LRFALHHAHKGRVGANARPDHKFGLGINLLILGGDALSGIVLPVHSNIARGNRTISPQALPAAPEIFVL
jgi:hypothetical protein